MLLVEPGRSELRRNSAHHVDMSKRHFICFPNPGQRAKLDVHAVGSRLLSSPLLIRQLLLLYFGACCYSCCFISCTTTRDDAFMRRRRSHAMQDNFSPAVARLQPREDRIERNLIFSNDLITISSSSSSNGGLH